MGKNNNILFCCIVGILLQVFSIHAVNAVDFKTFEVLVPDTVEQGKSFEATYHLVANNYKDWDNYRNGYFQFVSNDFDDNVITISGKKYYDVNNKITFIAYGTGLFQLPQLNVTVSGRKYICPPKKVFVRPNDAYKNEYQIAKEWFRNYSYDLDTCKMIVCKNNAHITILSDSKNQLSIAIAKKAKKLGIHPVVYWSTESDILFGNDNTQHKFLSYYSKQLENYDKRVNANNFQVNSYRKNSNAIKPLLGGIVYGPKEPYNLHQPIVGNEISQVGSISVLLTQIFAYHKYPSECTGKFTHYREIPGNSEVVCDDYSTVCIDWKNDFLEDYRKCVDTAKINKISKLAAAISNPIYVSYDMNGKNFYYPNIKMSLVNFWNYSPSIKLCTNNNPDTICGLIYKDLDNKRIPITSYKSDFFVCDGYSDDFLHINLGLYGSGNGYYHIPYFHDPQIEFPIDRLIVGIEPDTKEFISKVVSTDKPNTLRKILNEEECRDLRELSISGPLGNDDIKLLRQMLGAPADDCFEWCGKLRNLDLSQAKFVTDKKGYFFDYRLSGDAGSSWTTNIDNRGNSWTNNHHYYNYDRMSESDWKSFKSAGMDRRDCSIVKYENGVCIMYCHVKSGCISDAMFFSCDNLQQILLPKKTKRIMANSFGECYSLRSIKFPASVKECQKYTFSYNFMLEHILLNEDQSKSFDFKYLLSDYRRNPNLKLVRTE